MSTNTHISNAERFGNWLGRGWRGYVRRERQVSGWLAAQGVPCGAATVLLWIAKLAVLGVLFYAAFWLAVLIVVAVVAARSAHNADWETPEPEWQNGPAGFGLYTHDGYRIDPHVSDDD
jgi:hypothetical protein